MVFNERGNLLGMKHRKNRTILVTGGCGYIGSHVLVELLELGYEVVTIDNLCNSSVESIQRVEQITQSKVKFVQGDVRDEAFLETLFTNYPIQHVIHLAGLKSPIESLSDPFSYYDNNVLGTITLCKVMGRHHVKHIIFSSSATVYGRVSDTPVSENSPVGETTNPYGTSKYMVERALADLCKSDQAWRTISLRYFNPIGAHPSGLIGENPTNESNNLLPILLQVAANERNVLTIFGNDYPTKDGTGVRDYLHVVDLAKGHVAALEAVLNGFNAFNLGTGNGISVLELVRAFTRICKTEIPSHFAPRRAGDTAICFANPSRAAQYLGWTAQLSLEDMLQDAWRWQMNKAN